MTIDELISLADAMGASDVHLSEGMPVMFRVAGELTQVPQAMAENEASRMLESLLNSEQLALYNSGRDLDFAHCLPDGKRQRVNLFRQQGKEAGTIRLLGNHIPAFESLGLPPVLKSMAEQKRGIVLVTGPTGSGKSTTLASMLDYINQTRREHILTIEDPIEYVYESKASLVHQREVGRDVTDFASALRSALREDPDIILVGEMRDYETISAALTAAETGHLVLSTLHTTGVAQTVDRIVDACPAGVQEQVRSQLSGVLKCIVTQCLIPKIGGGRVVATEVLTGTDAVLHMIRENKGYQLKTAIQSGAAEGMHTLNAELERLVRRNLITRENALSFTYDKKELQEFME